MTPRAYSQVRTLKSAKYSAGYRIAGALELSPGVPKVGEYEAELSGKRRLHSPLTICSSGRSLHPGCGFRHRKRAAGVPGVWSADQTHIAALIESDFVGFDREV